MSTPRTVHRFYQNGHICTELDGAGSRSVLRRNGLPLAEYRSANQPSRSLLSVDSASTVTHALEGARGATFAYTPYGHCGAHDSAKQPVAFTGQLLDAATRGYLLGNGYRLFSPSLGRFGSADNLSPFGQGGLNGYGYCAGDPVNRHDPSGHMPVPFKYAALGFGVSSIGVLIAAVSTQSKPIKDLLYGASGALALAAVTGFGTGKAIQWALRPPVGQVPSRRNSLTPVGPPPSPTQWARQPPRRSLQLEDLDAPPDYDQVVMLQPNARPISGYSEASQSPPPAYRALFGAQEAVRALSTSVQSPTGQAVELLTSNHNVRNPGSARSSFIENGSTRT
ncbi:RHS repeat-associated core domain-containing protein [Pseudomonas cremoricolorata]|uniref:RHS repeat-associated core domain-containing protein n=1 Tax=Pseudomonas cremoricolorata TaxID=157783 RepID=UPI0009DC3595|nr:RHS repeat-associated core domain-containing protein [Pseudomonas cremoricolorata]